MNPWEDHEDYPSSDWQDEVANGDTRLGYPEWVQQQRDEADDNNDDEEQGHA